MENKMPEDGENVVPGSEADRRHAKIHCRNHCIELAANHLLPVHIRIHFKIH